MSHFAAVLDANVLHSYPLTALLLELAEARLYRPAWSMEIHAEWMRSVRKTRPDISDQQLTRRRAAMDTALPDACVTGYQRLIPALTLPDPTSGDVLPHRQIAQERFDLRHTHLSRRPLAIKPDEAFNPVHRVETAY